ncbi:hypothetical protein L208DRAFT_1319304, partial [Tricholoma matsutake]
WVTGCDDLKIKITAQAALPAVHKFHAEPEPTSLEVERQEYTKEAFVEAILEFIVGDDQSINIVELPRLRKIFLLLRKELQESDIPGCSTMRTRIEQVYEEHMNQLEQEMATLIVSQMGWITCDNASNNDTMFRYLSTLPQKCKININMDEQRIQ